MILLRKLHWKCVYYKRNVLEIDEVQKFIENKFKIKTHRKLFFLKCVEKVLL